MSNLREALEELCAKHEHGATRWQDPLPVPEWIGLVRGVLADHEAAMSTVPADILHDRLALALINVGITYVPQQERDPIYDKLARAVALVLAELLAELPAVVAAREHIAQVLHDTVQTLDKGEEWHLADMLLWSGGLRSVDSVKAEALHETADVWSGNSDPALSAAAAILHEAADQFDA